MDIKQIKSKRGLSGIANRYVYKTLVVQYNYEYLFLRRDFLNGSTFLKIHIASYLIMIENI